jgi:hypothetical protein
MKISPATPPSRSPQTMRLGLWAGLWALGATLHASPVPMATGRVLDQTQMMVECNSLLPIGVMVSVPVQFSSLHYAEVDSHWIPGFMDRFRSDLFRQGVPVNLATGKTGWQERFNCTGFTDLFVGEAGAELMVSLWQSRLQVERPAILVVWFLPDDPRRGAAPAAAGPRPGHAVVLILTEAGPKWWDPQSGEIHLSSTELSSIYHRRA